MTKRTSRDLIWDAALKHRNGLLDGGDGDEWFRVGEIADQVEADVSERTVRDCLLSMADLGHLDRIVGGPFAAEFRAPRDLRRRSQDTGTTQEVAVYECRCGNQVEIWERDYGKIRWATSKFGFKNIGSFISHNRACCDRPSYTSTVSREVRI